MIFVLSGPFWICTTLVFAIAISGNLSNFLVHLGKPHYKYTPEFRKGQCCYSSVLMAHLFWMNVRENWTFFLKTLLFLNLLYFPVTIAATAIFSYAWLVPLALWGFLLWRNNKIMNLVSYSFMEIVCVYGYSLSIYIPAVVRLEIFLYFIIFIVVTLVLNIYNVYAAYIYI